MVIVGPGSDPVVGGTGKGGIDQEALDSISCLSPYI